MILHYLAEAALNIGCLVAPTLLYMIGVYVVFTVKHHLHR